jgi:hypothetical protein
VEIFIGSDDVVVPPETVIPLAKQGDSEAASRRCELCLDRRRGASQLSATPIQRSWASPFAVLLRGSYVVRVLID